jgi:hypothetical protein
MTFDLSPAYEGLWDKTWSPEEVAGFVATELQEDEEAWDLFGEELSQWLDDAAYGLDHGFNVPPLQTYLERIQCVAEKHGYDVILTTRGA